MDLFAAIAAERRSLADVLTPLSVEQQEVQSLCDAWTVHQVVGHLVAPLTVGLPGFALAMLWHRGNFNRANDALARKQAQQSFGQLVETLRRKADSRFTPPGNGPEAPLTDIVVHGLDITRPLGLTLVYPSTHLTAILEHTAAQARKSSSTWEGVRLEADDLDWSQGSGPVVTGSATSLILALTGRPAGLQELRGAVPTLPSQG